MASGTVAQRNETEFGVKLDPEGYIFLGVFADNALTPNVQTDTGVRNLNGRAGHLGAQRRGERRPSSRSCGAVDVEAEKRVVAGQDEANDAKRPKASGNRGRLVVALPDTRVVSIHTDAARERINGELVSLARLAIFGHDENGNELPVLRKRRQRCGDRHSLTLQSTLRLSGVGHREPVRRAVHRPGRKAGER